jgi:hypothetical protein
MPPDQLTPGFAYAYGRWMDGWADQVAAGNVRARLKPPRLFLRRLHSRIFQRPFVRRVIPRAREARRRNVHTGSRRARAPASQEASEPEPPLAAALTQQEAAVNGRRSRRRFHHAGEAAA